MNQPAAWMITTETATPQFFTEESAANDVFYSMNILGAKGLKLQALYAAPSADPVDAPQKVTIDDLTNHAIAVLGFDCGCELRIFRGLTNKDALTFGFGNCKHQLHQRSLCEILRFEDGILLTKFHIIPPPQPSSGGAQGDALPGECEDCTALIADRDEAQEWADRLAAAISHNFGVDIGEHSSINNPWEVALEVIGNGYVIPPGAPVLKLSSPEIRLRDLCAGTVIRAIRNKWDSLQKKDEVYLAAAAHCAIDELLYPAASQPQKGATR